MKIGLIGAATVNVELLPLLPPDVEIQAFPCRIPLFAHTPLEFAVQQINWLEASLTAAASGVRMDHFLSFSYKFPNHEKGDNK